MPRSIRSRSWMLVKLDWVSTLFASSPTSGRCLLRNRNCVAATKSSESGRVLSGLPPCNFSLFTDSLLSLSYCISLGRHQNQLESVHIFECDLRRLSHYAFRGRVERTLTELTLSRNRFRRISNKTFAQFRNLRRIDLSRNNIRDKVEKGEYPIDYDLFRRSSAKVEILILKENELWKIPRRLLGWLLTDWFKPGNSILTFYPV